MAAWNPFCLLQTRKSGTRHPPRRRLRPTLEAFEDRCLPSTFVWFQNVDGNFNDPANWRDQNGMTGVPGAGDDAVIPGTGFTVTSSEDHTVQSLNANARLTVTAGTITVGDPINPSLLFQLVLDSGASFQVTAGTTFLTSGTDSHGSFDVSPGATLSFSGGMHHLDTGTTLAGAGHYRLSGGTLDIMDAIDAPPNFELAGGTLAGDGTFTVSNTTLSWTGGGMEGGMTGPGSTVIAPSGALAINGPDGKLLDTRSLTTNGPVTWAGAGSLRLDNGAVITNNSTWTLQGDQALTHALGPNGTFINNATGVVTKSTGPGAASVSAVFNNDGTVNGNSGTLQLSGGGFSAGTFNAAGTLSFTGLTQTLGAGAAFGGAGTVRVDGGTLVLNADVPATNFGLGSGTLSGTGTLTVAGNFAWTGGTMASPAGLGGLGGAVSNGALTINGPDLKLLAGGYTLTTNGTVTWAGAGPVRVDDGSVIANSGTWTLQGDQALTHALGTNGTFSNAAAGVVTKAAGTGAASIATVFNNDGTVTVNSGALQLGGDGIDTGTFNLAAATALQFTGGMHVLGAGTTVTGAGTVRVDGGTLTLNADVNVANFGLGSGLLTGTSTLTVAGTFAWTGGSMAGVSGTGGAVSNGALTISGPAAKVLDGGYTLTTNGTVTWTGPSDIRADNGVAILNTGTWTIQNDQALTHAFGISGTFSNAATGVVTKAAGLGVTSIDSTFNNDGTVNVNSGTVQLGGGGRSTGTFNGLAGTTLLFAGGTHMLLAGAPASLLSAGLVQVNGAAVILDTTAMVQDFELTSGSLELTGNGVLNVGGNYTQRVNSTLFIDLAGTTAGTGYGQLNVTGAANLAGTLTVNLTDGFSPGVGDSFTVLTFGSRTGDFGAKNLPPLGVGTWMEMDDPNDLTFTVV
jgi:hypothetical protein